MFNVSTEIVWILNMLLLNDKREPLKDNEIFIELEKAFAKNFGKPGSSTWKNLNMSLVGKHAVVIGRSNIVGKTRNTRTSK